MNQHLKRTGMLLAVIIAGGVMCSVAAEETNAPAAELSKPMARPQSITSHHRHFVVTGMSSGTALEVALWAESVRERISVWAGMPIPGDHAYPMVIEAVSRTNEPIGRVISAQVVNDQGQLRQAITLINYESMDQEDLLEALTGLLLNRWIHARQSLEARRARSGVFPEWMVVAVAQNLYPELKERNLRLIEDAEAQNEYAPASSIFFHGRFPPGRWREKAHAGLVGAWLAETLTASRWVDGAAQQLAASHPLDLAAMMAMLGMQNARAFDLAWDVWMARQSRRVIPGILSSDYRTAGRILEMRLEDIGLIFPGGSPGRALSVDLLIAERDKPWVRDVCQSISWKLQQAIIGKTPELVEVMRSFVDFFTQVPPPVKGERRKKLSDRALQSAWSKASASWASYIERESKRKAYIDSFTTGAEIKNQSEASEVKSWLDAWEKESAVTP